MTYLCAYFRFYHPLEFTTAFLNTAANDDDIANGTELAKMYGFKITNARYGTARGDYSFNKESNTISKGLSSIKYLGSEISDQLYECAKNDQSTFVDVLSDLYSQTAINSRQVEILIQIDFFSAFGNQRELLTINDAFEFLKRGKAKQVRKELIDGTMYEEAFKQYASGFTKSGKESKSYTIDDCQALLRMYEASVKAAALPDLPDAVKVRNFADVMGYAGYTTGKEEDRRKLYIRDIQPLKRKADGKQFGYSVYTQSIGSGVEARFTLFNRVYDRNPILAGSVIYLTSFAREGKYFTLTGYQLLDA